MGVGENIKHLRKCELKLSREKFGELLGVSRDVINNIELERLARPEQKEPLLKLICKEFNVNYQWITTGQGDMYTETKQGLIEKISAEYGLDFYVQRLIECYLKLNKEQQACVSNYLKLFVESCSVDILNNRSINGVSNELCLSNIKKPTEEVTATNEDV